ncbi:hypothetical protein N483_13625 [Pseudoalteromonas luteoviolacea NCIMB 1944]|nr:hypothetical protein N483_13625 [Pseudoalteromonas luteoviolacea NCIMB 1944]
MGLFTPPVPKLTAMCNALKSTLHNSYIFIPKLKTKIHVPIMKLEHNFIPKKPTKANFAIK